MTAKLKLPVFLFGLALAGVVWATASVGNVQEDLFISEEVYFNIVLKMLY